MSIIFSNVWSSRPWNLALNKYEKLKKAPEANFLNSDITKRTQSRQEGVRMSSNEILEILIANKTRKRNWRSTPWLNWIQRNTPFIRTNQCSGWNEKQAQIHCPLVKCWILRKTVQQANQTCLHFFCMIVPNQIKTTILGKGLAFDREVYSAQARGSFSATELEPEIKDWLSINVSHLQLSSEDESNLSFSWMFFICFWLRSTWPTIIDDCFNLYKAIYRYIYFVIYRLDCM